MAYERNNQIRVAVHDRVIHRSQRVYSRARPRREARVDASHPERADLIDPRLRSAADDANAFGAAALLRRFVVRRC